MLKAFLAMAFLFACAIPAHAGSCPASVPSGITNCFYVDYTVGSDSNSGASESSPWKHAPGMQGLNTSGGSTGDGCAANCASNNPAAGNGYILKGGSIWPYTTAPWSWIWSGSSSGSPFGCSGPGCIYIGYDPTWNQGDVNSVTLTRDLGGCSPSSPPTVSFSGGGGSGAAATAKVIPAAAGNAEPNVAGFIYHVTVTSQGSGYTSNPTIAIGGGGCTYATAVADIQRPVLDYGQGSGIDWPVGSGTVSSLQNGPGLTAQVSYVIIDHLELRNILQVARAVNGVPDGIQTGFITFGTTGTNYDTVSNNYIHGRFTDCVLNSCNANNQEQADSAINMLDQTGEVSGNVIENGDAYQTGTSSTSCGNNSPCTFSEHDVRTCACYQGTGEMQHNIEYAIRWMTHWGGNATAIPALIHDNEMWLVLYDVGSAHVNEMYLEYTTGTVYNYNNIFHSAVSGASNQQQMGNGTTQYFFNNVSWGLGGGTYNYSIDTQNGAGSGGGRFYFYNNTMYANSSATTFCISAGGSSSFVSDLSTVLQNNHCISNQNPYWGVESSETWKNQVGSTTVGTIEASSTVQSASTANSQGYTISTLFAPTSASNDTVALANNANSANLTGLCSGYLVALCSDINGNPRPASGGWQAGAYTYGGGSSQPAQTPPAQTPPAPPTGLTISIQ
jgi:hypothetical protein